MSPSPWKKQGATFECCHYCVPPKRHPHCHSTCKDYKKEKESFEAKKKWLKENETPKITNRDFNKVAYNWAKLHKK